MRWEEPVEVASGPASVGPWRMNESEWDYVDDPAVAAGEDGGIALAWVDQSRKDVLFQRYGSDREPRFVRPTDVSRSPETFSWLPRVALAPGAPNEVYLLWQEILFTGGTHGGEILFARSGDGGRSFGEPINLSNSPEGDGKGRLTRRLWHNGSLDVAAGPGGAVYAAWTEYEGRLWFARSTDGGETFGEPRRVAGDDSEPARGPSLATGSGERLYLTWTFGSDPAADVHLAVSEDGGSSFGTPRTVAAGEGHSDAPTVAVSGRDTVHLAWGESPSGPLRRYRVLYARSSDGGGAWQEPREISGPADERFESASYPNLALDGDSNLYVLWHLFAEAGERPRGLGFTHSRDGGRSFAAPAVVPGSADPALGFTGSRQGLLAQKLAARREGEVVVANSTFRSGESSHVWLIRGRAPGRR